MDEPSGTKISERSDSLRLPKGRQEDADARPTIDVTGIREEAGRLPGEKVLGWVPSSAAAGDAASGRSASSNSPLHANDRKANHAAPDLASPSHAAPTGRYSVPTPDAKASADPSERKSFWRRISIGRKAPIAAASTDSAIQRVSAPIPQTIAAPQPAILAVVEPLLQSLVSVEAKLERSHVELSSRLENIDQRLTQLWEIDEQLGSLGDIQEGIGHLVDLQQHLAEAQAKSARTLRVLAILLVLGAAASAFTIAMLLR